MGWAILALSVVASGLIGVLFHQARRLKGLNKDLKTEEAKTKTAVKKIGDVTELHNNQQAIQERADEQKNNLEKTDDSDLVDRADTLFP